MYENLKEIIFDEDIQVETYKFDGVAQAFPMHFHEYYVIGLIEAGDRELIVNNQILSIGPGDMMTFNPFDKHSCKQMDTGALTYRCINIKIEIMRSIVEDIFGYQALPNFSTPVQQDKAIAEDFRHLHIVMMNKEDMLEKEGLFLCFMEQLLSNYASFSGQPSKASERKEIEIVCDFLEQHYREKLSLNMLSEVASLNKYSLVRLFTREKGITPYRYLETIRINHAKKLLEEGVSATQVAHELGFTDQSHFSTYFSRFMGISPGQYQAIFPKREVQ